MTTGERLEKERKEKKITLEKISEILKKTCVIQAQRR